MAGEVTFAATADDYLAANRDWFRHKIRRRPALLRSAATVVIVATIGGLLFTESRGWESAALTAIAFGLLALLAIAIGYGVQLLMMPFQVRRLYRQQKSLQEPWRYAWTDKGLEFAAIHGEARLEWPYLYRWSDGPRTFLFMLNDQLFYFLPFHALTDAQIDDLRSTATQFGPPRF